MVNLETKQAVRIAVDEISNKSSPAASVPPRKKTPMPRSRTSDPVDLDDGERTTASITSISSTGNRNPFDDEDLDKGNHNDINKADDLVGVESGRVKRFIREMRSKGKGISCRNADTVAEEQSKYFRTMIILMQTKIDSFFSHPKCFNKHAEPISRVRYR